jgi:hypothetical protein
MSAIRIEEHVAVHQVGARTLHVDIFQPARLAGPVPGLLFLPGGGWRTADRALSSAKILSSQLWTPSFIAAIMWSMVLSEGKHAKREWSHD